MHRYFVSYASRGAFGSTEIQLAKPIRGFDDIKVVSEIIGDVLRDDTVVVLFWAPFPRVGTEPLTAPRRQPAPPPATADRFTDSGTAIQGLAALLRTLVTNPPASGDGLHHDVDDLIVTDGYVAGYTHRPRGWVGERLRDMAAGSIATPGVVVKATGTPDEFRLTAGPA